MSDYTPRFTSAGIRYDYKWYSENPFYLAGYGLANCTAYVWGRWWEVAGGHDGPLPNGPTTLCTGNAEDWYNWNDGYSRGTTPRLGAIACYKDGIYSGLGHVCVLEAQLGDGTWRVSESAYNGYFFRSSHSIQANGTYDNVSGYIFQGFIYNPYAGDTPTPPIPGGSFKWWLAKPLIERGQNGGSII